MLFLRSAVALALLCGVLGVAAQPLIESRYEDLVGTANYQLELNRPYNALNLFKQAYDQQRSDSLALTIAELNYELRDYRSAVSYFQRALRKAADGALPGPMYRLGVSLKMQGNYVEAKEVLREFMLYSPNDPLAARAQLELDGIDLAEELVEPPRIKVENAGRSVNTSNQEYSPTIAGDGDLYYTGFAKSGYLESAEAPDIEVYSAAASSDGGFDKGRSLPKNINRPGTHTTGVSLSADGEEMLLVRTTLDGTTELTSDLYYAAKSGTGWRTAERIDNVNGSYLAKHPTFGELYGQRVIFFASDMPGGQGGLDLYYANAKGDGNFDRPVNLGPEINSAFDDITPHYRDGTLYWSTDGRPTLGGFDVYRSDWGGEAWTTPVNMGKGFNSSLDDRYFGLDASGKKGVLASNRAPTRSVKSKTCCDDVFLLNVEPVIIDLLITTVDAEGQLLPNVTVDLATLEDGDTTVISRKLNPKGNRFDFDLVDGSNYIVIGRRDGYSDGIAELNTVGISEPTELARTLQMIATEEPTETDPGEETIEITLNQPIRLANIYYDFDDDEILPASEPDLNYLLELMNEYPELVVELGSHTDARGKDSYNQELSQRRAESARGYLLARDVAPERVQARGYGEELILNRCTNGVRCDDDEHRFNRRTSFTILEGPQAIQVRKMTKTQVLPDGTVAPREATPQSTPSSAPQNKQLPQGGGDGKVVSLSAAELSELVEGSRNGVVTDDLSSLYYESSVADLPVLAFSDRRIDFGVVERGDKRQRRYAFRNVGSVPATIGIVSACTCTTLDWTKGEIAPGEAGFVDAVFDSSDKDAGELIVIDIILDQETASGNGIIERVQYSFGLQGE